MPPVDTPQRDPLVVLLDEIEILSAQTRLMELYLKRANTAAFGEFEKIQEQFRVKVTNLKAKLEEKGSSLPGFLPDHQNEEADLSIQNQELSRRLAEQANLIEQNRIESERRAAEIESLRERLASVESANRQSENAAAQHGERSRQELESQIAQLQTELAQSTEVLQRSQSAASQMEQSAQAKIRALAEELARSRDFTERHKTEMESAESQRRELRQRLSELEAFKAQVEGHAGREIEILRQDGQAKISALQSEISHKTALLTRNQNTIARLEQEIKAASEALQSEKASQQALIRDHAVAIQRRDADIAGLQRRIAEIEDFVQRQQSAGADELAKAREIFSAEVESLRSELREKQQILDHGQGFLQDIEQELRNRNRELQGQIAAKESVIESQEDQLRQVQMESLTLRDALANKERSLAEMQTRSAEMEQSLHAQRQDWQCQLSEKQLLVERYSAEVEQAKAELAQTRQIIESEGTRLSAALASQQQLLDERNALSERAQQLIAEVGGLKIQIEEKQATIDSQADILRHKETQAAEFGAALAAARGSLEELEAKARGAEQDFERRFAELRAELETKEQALSESDVAASRAEPEFKAKIEDLENRLSEKDRVLETRAREIAVLQARVDSLVGQTARLEATQKQALADAAGETERVRQGLQTEIAVAQEAREKHQTLFAEQQATFHDIEKELRGEIDALKEELKQRQTLLEKHVAELRQAETDAGALRERIAQFESIGHRADAVAAETPNSTVERIATLEHQLRSTAEKLAEREAELERAEQRLRSQDSESRNGSSPDQSGSDDAREQLRTAQEKIADLLERLSQLEKARHELQENAGHELQQVRASFEARIEQMRMKLAANESSSREQPSEMSRAEEDFKAQLRDLQSQLAEKHSLLENRNEELIKVKTEMDALQDHLAQLQSRLGQESINARFSLELREEDAVEAPLDNGAGEPSDSASNTDPSQSRDAPPGTNTVDGALDAEMLRAEKSDGFTHLEERVRPWNPGQGKDTANGAGRRWNMNLFKRRWKN